MKNKKRPKRELIEGVQNALEANRRFDKETIPSGTHWSMPDETFRYRKPWYERIETGFWRCILGTLGPLLIKLAFHAKVVGKENLKAIKGQGAVTVCNHIHFLDTLFVRQAVGHFNSYHTMAPCNNKKGIGGHIIRHGGMWPFSTNISAMKHLSEEMERQLKRGKRINFYPEQAMWWNYQKPRPMKDGAFHYAVKFGVPVLPIFCTFDKSKRGGMKKLKIHILPAVYADERLSRKEQIRTMKALTEAEWQACYEESYGKPLVYLSKNESTT